jgi:O-antigen ligase
VITSRTEAPARALRAVQWALLLLLVVTLLWSALVSPLVPAGVRALLLALVLLTAVSPGWGLAALSTLGPLGYLIATRTVADWDVSPLDLPQALVLAFFAGYIWAERRNWLWPERPRDPFAVPARLFTVVVAGSLLVQLHYLQVWHDFPLPYAREFLRYLHTDYLTTSPDVRPWVDGRGLVAVAALMLEGIALMRCTRRLCQRDPRLPERLAIAAMIAALTAAAGTISVVSAAAGAAHRSFLWALTFGRWSPPAMPSLNTAGPFYLLACALALGVAVGVRKTPSRVVRLTCWIGAAIVFAAMWFTQTRSAIVSAIAVSAAAAVASAMKRAGLPVRRVAGVALASVVLVALLVVLVNPFGILARGIQRSLLFRVEFASTALRMIRTAPMTGIGVGQYESHFRDFASAALLEMDPRANNAHNYLLWMTAELGVIGVLPFVWLLCVAVREAIGAARRFPGPGFRVWLGGLAAYGLTWTVGQPLSISTAAIAFWIALGMVVASDAHDARAPVATPVGAPRGRRALRFVPVAYAVLVAATIPVQSRRALAQVDLGRVAYGVYNAGSSADRHFRWGGPRIRLYVRRSVPMIDLAIGSEPPLTPNGAAVEALVDGRRVESVTLKPGEWRTLRLQPYPAGRSEVWQVDLIVAPIDLPATTPDEERRIAVGAIELVGTRQ